MMENKIFFNSSLPRSGSTLLQNIIGQNPKFYVTPTSGLLELIFAARANYTNSPEFKAQNQELMKKAFLNFCKEGMIGYFKAITNKPYIVDKSRGWGIHYPLLNQIYPEAKVICIVRDLRDIIASMEKIYRKNMQRSNGVINHSEMKGTTTFKRADIWLHTIPIGLAIERIGEIFHQGINKNMHFVRYEDLLNSPQNEMNKIYEYFGVEKYVHNFEHIEQITIEDDVVYGAYGDHSIQTSLAKLKQEHKQILGNDVCYSIKDKYKWYFDLFDYK
jgi:sulfotransferase